MRREKNVDAVRQLVIFRTSRYVARVWDGSSSFRAKAAQNIARQGGVKTQARLAAGQRTIQVVVGELVYLPVRVPLHLRRERQRKS